MLSGLLRAFQQAPRLAQDINLALWMELPLISLRRLRLPLVLGLAFWALVELPNLLQNRPERILQLPAGMSMIYTCVVLR